MKITKYNGNDIFTNFDAGLYGIHDYEDCTVDIENSKIDILEAFKKEFETDIAEKLANAGLKLENLEYYSPKFYNYATDSIDIAVSLENEKLLLEYINNNTAMIQKILDSNKSYNGYIALTPDDITGVYNNGDIDISLITAILSNIDFSDFDIYEYLVINYPCETCELVHEDVEWFDSEDTAKAKACLQS